MLQQWQQSWEGREPFIGLPELIDDEDDDEDVGSYLTWWIIVMGMRQLAALPHPHHYHSPGQSYAVRTMCY